MINIGMGAEHPQIIDCEVCAMSGQPAFETYRARIGRLKEHVREEFAADVIREFSPMVAPYGFTDAEWFYEKEHELVEVLFQDPTRPRAVRIDCSLDDGRFASNYCRAEGEWEICVEGRPKSFSGLKRSLRRWIERNCEDCCLNCPVANEIEERAEEAVEH